MPKPATGTGVQIAFPRGTDARRRLWVHLSGVVARRGGVGERAVTPDDMQPVVLIMNIRMTSGAVLAALVTGVTVLGAGSASAASYRCTTSSKTIDHPGSTALSDDFDFKVATCAKREGGYVYSKFTVDIDGPPGFSGY
ncbi:hypothetical protein [Streptomyces sp. N35]|uniref:hypothetical protein n=1 Tax=Streptomyces sp. N35 TaxID=2795730 RepID=UPI0018F3D4BD|nr:hypothetical protein [Streptomyces sp. N35]